MILECWFSVVFIDFIGLLMENVIEVSDEF